MAVENTPMVNRKKILRMIRRGELSIDDLPPELRDDPQFIDMLTQLQGLRKREVAAGVGGTLARTAAGAMMPVVPAAAPALSQIAFGTPITPQAPEWDPAARERAMSAEAYKATVPEVANILAADAKLAEQLASVLPDLAGKVFTRQTDKERLQMEASWKRSSLLKDYDLKRLDLYLGAQKVAAKNSGEIDTPPEILHAVRKAMLPRTHPVTGRPIQKKLMEIFGDVANNTEEVPLVFDAIMHILESDDPNDIQLAITLPEDLLDLDPTAVRGKVIETAKHAARALLPAKAGGREAQEKYLLGIMDNKISDPHISPEQAAAILEGADQYFLNVDDPEVLEAMVDSLAKEAVRVGVPDAEVQEVLGDVAQIFGLQPGASGAEIVDAVSGPYASREAREGAIKDVQERLTRHEEGMKTPDTPYRTMMQRQQVLQDPAMRAKLATAAQTFGLGTDSDTLDDIYRAFATGHKHHKAKQVQATPSVLNAIARGESKDSVLGALTAKRNNKEGKQRRAWLPKIGPGGTDAEEINEKGESPTE